MGAERNEETMPHTSPDQLKAFFDRVTHLEQPEDLFGHLGFSESEQLQRLETCYKSLIKSYHPDSFADQSQQLSLVADIGD
jgi:hypothetical protein